MYVYCVYPAISKKSENLSDLIKKKKRQKQASFLIFYKCCQGVFFAVRVTFVPVYYLSAPSALHSYRVPGDVIRLLYK